MSSEKVRGVNGNAVAISKETLCNSEIYLIPLMSIRKETKTENFTSRDAILD